MPELGHPSTQSAALCMIVHVLLLVPVGDVLFGQLFHCAACVQGCAMNVMFLLSPRQPIRTADEDLGETSISCLSCATLRPWFCLSLVCGAGGRRLSAS